jgi:ABC-2 type transport system ATP-binding protein
MNTNAARRRPEPVIEARGLTRRFGDLTAVDALDLIVEPRHHLRLSRPQRLRQDHHPAHADRTADAIRRHGATVLGHQLPRDAERLKRQIGYMTQKFSLYDDLTVPRTSASSPPIYGLGHREARRGSTSCSRPMRWSRCATGARGRMSGGQRQRLALAAATIHEPALLFLDEPTSAVDPENRRDFWERLFDLVDAGASILVSTHYMDEAERCHRLAIMESGHKRADGSPAGADGGHGCPGGRGRGAEPARTQAGS